MVTTTESAPLVQKARELCGFVVEQESYRDAWKDVQAFLDDAEARQAYRAWQEKGAEVHQRRHQGIRPSEGEVSELEALKRAVMTNPLAANFVHAEGHINEIFDTVTKLLQKTLQMGRVPSEEEMEDCGGCGGHGGCGCH